MQQIDLRMLLLKNLVVVSLDYVANIENSISDIFPTCYSWNLELKHIINIFRIK